MNLISTIAIACALSLPVECALGLQEPGSVPSPNSQSSTVPQSQNSGAQSEIRSAPAQNPAASKKKVRGEQTNPSSPPRKIVIRRGSTPEPTAQLAPGMTQEQANQKRNDAEKLLSTTETSLKELESRKLNSQQEETVSQIRNYMTGARSALKDNDTQRARTLAFKAQLLADDLLKQ